MFARVDKTYSVAKPPNLSDVGTGLCKTAFGAI